MSAETRKRTRTAAQSPAPKRNCTDLLRRKRPPDPLASKQHRTEFPWVPPIKARRPRPAAVSAFAAHVRAAKTGRYSIPDTRCAESPLPLRPARPGQRNRK